MYIKIQKDKRKYKLEQYVQKTWIVWIYINLQNKYKQVKIVQIYVNNMNKILYKIETQTKLFVESEVKNIEKII